MEDPTTTSNTRTIAEDEQTVVSGTTEHKVYDPVNDRFLRLSDTDFTAGDFRPAVYDASNDTFRRISSGDTYWRTGYNSYSHALNNAAKQSYTLKAGVANTLAASLDADFTYAGGTVLAFTDVTNLLFDEWPGLRGRRAPGTLRLPRPFNRGFLGHGHLSCRCS